MNHFSLEIGFQRGALSVGLGCLPLLWGVPALRLAQLDLVTAAVSAPFLGAPAAELRRDPMDISNRVSPVLLLAAVLWARHSGRGPWGPCTPSWSG